MAVIAPALLAETVDDFKRQADILAGFTKRAHIDIADGIFAPNTTVPSTHVAWPTGWQVDIHAMVDEPSKHVQQLASLRPSLVIFHSEVKEDLIPIINYLKQYGIKAGIALQRATVPITVEHLIQAADHVMIFSGKLGHYGGTASLMQLEKVRLIKRINNAAEIGWDGGVTVENAFALSQGGVDVLNVGGTIAKSSDPAATYNKLTEEVNKQGVL